MSRILSAGNALSTLPPMRRVTQVPGVVNNLPVINFSPDAFSTFVTLIAVLLVLKDRPAPDNFLLQHPEIRLLRVEGHADDAGTSAYNYDLSTRRAQAVVDWLTRAGVEPERLVAMGTGEALPREGEDCTEADTRCASRRVEFLVLVWDEGGEARVP